MGALSNYPGARGGLRGASTGPVVPGVGAQVRGGGRDEARNLWVGGVAAGWPCAEGRASFWRFQQLRGRPGEKFPSPFIQQAMGR